MSDTRQAEVFRLQTELTCEECRRERPDEGNDTMQPEPGDWIRFQRGGQLVIDQIEYIFLSSPKWHSHEAVTLSSGKVSFAEILELRAARQPQEPTA